MPEHVTVRMGILYLDLFMSDAQSLKDKRQVLKSLKDRVRAKFNVSVAELDGLDKWQTATLGFGMLSTDSRYIDRELQNIVSFVESFHALQICRQEVELI